MRYTYGTIAAMTCSILVLATYWPGSQPPMMSQGVAQSDLKVPQAADSNSPNPEGKVDEQGGQELVDHPFQGSKEEIERKLSQPLPEQNIVELPFNALMAELGGELGVTIFLDPVITKFDSIINSEELITLQFPAGTVSAKTLINYAIRSLERGDQLGYTIRDNMVVITDKFETYETVIYNCSDLLRPSAAPSVPGEMGGGEGGFGSLGNHSSQEMMTVQFGGGLGSGEGYGDGGMGGMPRLGGGMGFGPGGCGGPQTSEGQLVEVITTTVEPDSWSYNGGTGAISSLNGLIIVKHTREVQDEVKDLLQKLRDARKE